MLLQARCVQHLQAIERLQQFLLGDALQGQQHRQIGAPEPLLHPIDALVVQAVRINQRENLQRAFAKQLGETDFLCQIIEHQQEPVQPRLVYRNIRKRR